MWFEELAGFAESDVANVAAEFVVDGEYLTSRVSNRRIRFGRFETPSLADLRQRTDELSRTAGQLTFREIVADVQTLHLDPASAGATFQVASQFNTLEMVGPGVTPEEGIGIYEHDHTQGPACAIAGGAGTIYRNYFAPVGGKTGQTRDRQINCIADVLGALASSVEVRNGYVLPTADELEQIHNELTLMDDVDRDDLMMLLQVGVQWDTEVTLAGAGHAVTQVFGSALPVAYAFHDPQLWEPFARLVLNASYEATLHVAACNASATGNNRVYLTMLGGGAFGNATAWIVDAIEKSLNQFADHDLDVVMVSYGQTEHHLRRLLTQ